MIPQYDLALIRSSLRAIGYDVRAQKVKHKNGVDNWVTYMVIVRKNPLDDAQTTIFDDKKINL